MQSKKTMVDLVPKSLFCNKTGFEYRQANSTHSISFYRAPNSFFSTLGGSQVKEKHSKQFRWVFPQGWGEDGDQDK